MLLYIQHWFLLVMEKVFNALRQDLLKFDLKDENIKVNNCTNFAWILYFELYLCIHSK